MKTLLIGMGNPIVSDDAVGVRLATDYKKRLADIPNLTVMEEVSVGGLTIMELVEGYDRLIIVDSIKSVDGKPGDWCQFTGVDLRETMNLRNVHDMNFATAMELGRRMGHKVPSDEEIIIFAVEVLDNLTFSEKMSDVMEERYAEYASEIEAEIRALLNGAGDFPA